MHCQVPPARTFFFPLLSQGLFLFLSLSLAKLLALVLNLFRARGVSLYKKATMQPAMLSLRGGRGQGLFTISNAQRPIKNDRDRDGPGKRAGEC